MDLPSLLLPLACLFGACRSMHSEQADQALTLALGDRTSNEWSGFDGPWLLQLGYEVQGKDWPCAAEVALQVGEAYGPDAPVSRDISLSDMSLGAAKGWKPAGWLRLQAGAGLRLAQASLMGPGFLFEEEIDSDTSLGLYAHLGAYVQVSGTFSIGLDGRWADGTDFHLEQQSYDAQLTQLLLALRWDF